MSKVLDELTDALNEELTRAEEKLAAMRLTVTARVKMPSGKVLFFGKEEAEWGLFILHEDGAKHALTKASRDTRVEAAGCLEEMEKALLAAREAHTSQVKLALEQVRRFNAKER